jgi:hypothetical protein
MRRKTYNTIGAFVALLGGLLVIGTLAAAELDRISGMQAVVQSTIGVGVATLGGRLFGATYDPADYYYKEDENEVDYENLDD